MSNSISTVEDLENSGQTMSKNGLSVSDFPKKFATKVPPPPQYMCFSADEVLSKTVTFQKGTTQEENEDKLLQLLEKSCFKPATS